jgi:acyl-CoA dehydrogenase
MALSLSADQILMRDEARRLLGERADSASLRRAIDAGGFDAGLWRKVGRELGWCAVAIPESAGGLGLGALELALLAEETGRRLAPIPFWSTACLAAPLIQRLAADAPRADLLSRIVDGAAVAVALPDLASATPFADISITAKRTDEGYALSGRAAPVLDLASADILLVPALLDDGATALFALTSAHGFAIGRLESLDLARPAGALALNDLRVSTDARIDRGDMDAAGAAAAFATARLGLAAEQVGAAQGCFDLTLAYIAQRVQFGRTIASFQAIKHRCAALMVDIAEARALAYGAAVSLDARSADARPEIAAAGALASQALFRAAEEAIQLHGGVGATWDYDPHLYLRRAQASAFMLGSADDRLAEIADALLGEAA